MMVLYFQNCKDLIEAKKHYFELALLHHPDKGGDTETFQEIKRQYEEFTVRDKNSTANNNLEYISFTDFLNDPQFNEIIVEFEQKTGISVEEIKQTVSIIDKFIKLLR
jgi:curved DNA-binding protein CbpA